MLRFRRIVFAAFVLVAPRILAQPDNDMFVNSEELFGTNISASAYNVDATLEPGEPDHAAWGEAVGSVWYHWRAPRDGYVDLQLVYSSFSYPAASVYTGPTLSNLTVVARSPDWRTGFFEVQAGVVYRIAFASRTSPYSPGFGVISFELKFLDPLANDNFANRTHLSGADYDLECANAGATMEPGEPLHAGIVTSNSVWWSWTAPADGVLMVRTYNYQFEPAVALYRGTELSNLVERISYAGNGFRVMVTGGETYNLAVASRYGRGGQFHMRLTFSSLRILEPANGSSFQLPVDIPFRFALQPGLVGRGIELRQNGFTPIATFDPAETYLLHDPEPGLYKVYAVLQGTNLEDYYSPPVEFEVKPRAHDVFAERIRLEGTNVIAETDPRGATPEPGEPPPGAAPSAVWWTWTPPITGRAIISHEAINSIVHSEVFTGDTLETLTAVPAAPAFGWNSFGAFPVTAGTNYQLRSYVAYGTVQPFVLRIKIIEPPPHDNFTNARTIDSDSVIDNFDWFGATREPGEPNANLPGRELSVWYRWRAPASGRVTLRAWTTEISLFKGTALTNLQFVAGHSPSFESPVEKGTLYYMLIEGTPTLTESGDPVPVEFRMRGIGQPANDNFANVFVLQGTSGQIDGNNEFATTERGESGAERSVWYTWQAPYVGTLSLAVETFNNPGYSFNAYVQVFTGTAINALTRLASGKQVDVAVTPGQVYRISVGGVAQSTASDLRLHWTSHNRPGNDSFARRIKITGTHITFTGGNWNATREAGEPAHAGLANGRSVWWTWTAPYSGYVRLTATNESFVPWIGAYQGAQLSQLQRVSSQSSGAASFQAVKGATYHFAADLPNLPYRNSAVGGDLTLNLDLTSIVLVSPSRNQTYVEPKAITFAINTPLEAVDGIITNVEFRIVGSTTLSIVTQPPFTATTNLPPGNYVVTAVAQNTLGETRVSRPEPFAIRPRNDDFERAWIINGRKIALSGSTAAAARQPGEPNHTGAPAGRSVWFRWTAPASGGVSVFVRDANAFAYVYQGKSLGNLTRIASSYPATRATFQATKGVTYYIAVEAPIDPHYLDTGPFNFFLDQQTLFVKNPVPTGDYIEPGPIVLRASTTELPADFTGIDFIVNNEVVGAATRPAPYTFRWRDISAGLKTITARAQLTSGQFITSNPVKFHVKALNDTLEGRLPISGSDITLKLDLSAAKYQANPNDIPGLWYSWRAPAHGLATFYINTAPYQPTVQMGLAGPNMLIGLIPHSLATQEFGRPTFVVQSNVLYAVFIGAKVTVPQPADIRLKFLPAPTNDNFADRVPVLGTNTLVTGSSIMATAEPGEPLHLPNYLQGPMHSAWWTWTAPADGLLRVDPSTVAVYTGNTLPSLVRKEPIIRPRDREHPFYEVQSNTVYQLAYDHVSELITEYQWQLIFEEGALANVPTGTNDNFASRIIIQHNFTNIVTSNEAATKESGEPNHGGFAGGRSLWWTWTAPDDGVLTLANTTEYFAPVFAVYTGESYPVLNRVTNGLAYVRARVTSNTTYQIALDGRDANGAEVHFDVVFESQPYNDDFEHRAPLYGSTLLLQATNTWATRQFKEPLHANWFGGHSLWWTWTPSISGTATIRVDPLWSLIAVYTGQQMTSLQPIASRAGPGWTDPNILSFDAVRGQEYVIAVDGANGAAGPFSLALNQVPFPPPVLKVLNNPPRLVLDSTASVLVIIEASQDLQHWFPILTNTANVIDLPLTVEVPAVFFRAYIP